MHIIRSYRNDIGSRLLAYQPDPCVYYWDQGWSDYPQNALSISLHKGSTCESKLQETLYKTVVFSTQLTKPTYKHNSLRQTQNSFHVLLTSI